MALTKAPEELLDRSFTTGLSISLSDNTDNLTLTSTDTDDNPGPNIRLYRNSANPAVNDLLGKIDFEGRNDNSQDVLYASISGKIMDETDGTEDANLRFWTIVNGTETETLTLGSGKVLIGHTAARNVGYSDSAVFRIEGTSYPNASIATVLNSNNANGPSVVLGKSRGTSVGSNTVVQDNDNLGVIDFVGSDGTDMTHAGVRLSAAVDGTPGSNDMPGRFVISTTADGASSPTERMRIASNGTVSVGRTESAGATDHGIDLYGNGYLYIFSVASGNTDTFRSYNSSGTLKAAIEADGDYIDNSDARLKENIEDAATVLTTIKNIKVRSFDWIEGSRKQSYGFVAQELKDVVPEATKIAEKEGDMWGVKNSRIVPMLTKAIQEQQTLIETLQTKVKALEEA